MKITRAESAILLLIGAFICLQLMWSPMVGLASNGDFERMMRWGGLAYVTDQHDEKYFGWINREFRFVENPWQVWRGFGSSEILFIKLSAGLRWLLPGDRFDLRWLGLAHLLGFLAGLLLLIKGWQTWTRRSPFWLLPGLLFFFCDIGYTAYFHSFYSEPASLIFLLAMTGAGLHLSAQPEKSFRALVIFCFCAGAFLAARTQHFALIPFLSLFCVRLFGGQGGWWWRKTLLVFVVTLFVAAALVSVVARRYTNFTRYHSVFYGILKGSPTPQQDLRELGLNEKFAVLADTTVFHPNLPFDIHGREFSEQFYQRTNHGQVLRFYLTHPRRFLDKLQLTAAHANTLRIDYGGNFEKNTGLPARTKARRWSVWSDFKQRYWPKSFWFFVGFFALSGAVIVKGYRQSRCRLAREFCLLLWLAMPVAFVTPILGDGESDLARHLFLFNALHDLLLWLGLACGLCWLSPALKRAMLQSVASR